MDFPVQDSEGPGLIFVEKINQNVYRLLNNSGVAIAQLDYVLFAGFLGVANQAAANGEYFDLLVDDEIEIHSNLLVTGADTFLTLYQTVYFNPTDKKFGDAVGSGIPVGKLSQIKDSDGMIKFFNLVKIMPLAGEVSTIEIEVAEDASAGITFNPGYPYEILDVVAYSTLTVASATVTLSDGTDAITDAIDIDTISTRIAALTVDEVFRVISGTDVLTLTTASAADRCRLLVSIKAI